MRCDSDSELKLNSTAFADDAQVTQSVHIKARKSWGQSGGIEEFSCRWLRSPNFELPFKRPLLDYENCKR